MATVHAATTEEIRAAWGELWGGLVVTPERTYRPGDVQGAVIRDDETRDLALVTWALDGEVGEIVTMNAMAPGGGHGMAALRHAEEQLRKAGAKRIKLFTTNDALRAHDLYFRQGYRLVRLHLDAMEAVRALKPSVPRTGIDGIPLRDMWELEKAVEG
ncbi:MAG: GNAT family N-acetyltransferase [Tepidiformaceae bacterium]